MRDFKPFELHIVNSVAILLSFYLGYKYAVKKLTGNKDQKGVQNNRKVFGEGVNDQTYSHYKNYKMVLLVRTDLPMSKGKIAAQCSHGAVGAYQKAMQRQPNLVKAWDCTGSAKIALKVENEKELMALKRAAEANLLNTCLICDAGRTQIEPNTKTVLAIGPGLVDEIDKITGHLKLL